MCDSCEAMRRGVHPRVVWMTPQNGIYVREAFDHLFSKLMLSSDETQYAIIESAELLNATSANMLLKTLEEPPVAWQFHLLSERPALLLPTIRSRCYEHHGAFESVPHGPIVQALHGWLLRATYHTLPDFDAWVATVSVTSRELPSLFDDLLACAQESHLKEILFKMASEMIHVHLDTITPVVFFRMLYIRSCQNPL